MQPEPNDLLLGKGAVYFNRFDAAGNPTGERFLGNVSRFELTTEDETKEKYSDVEAAGGLIKKVVARRTPAVSMTLDEVTPENLALVLLGSVAPVGQTAGVLSPLTIQGVRQGRYYHVGVRHVSNVVVTDYDEDDDYTVDAVSGRIYIVPGGGIDTGADIVVTCSYGDDDSLAIAGGAAPTIEGSLRYKGDPQAGPAYEVEVWRCSIAAEGVVNLISEDWAEAPVELEIYDASGTHPDAPFYRAIALGTRTTGLVSGRIYAVKTRGYALAFMSDWHIPRPASTQAAIRGLIAEVIEEAGAELVALVLGGDNKIAPQSDVPFRTWIRDPEGGALPPWVRLVTTLGNHDTMIPFQDYYDQTPSSPHANALAEFPELFGGKEWYIWDHESVRLVVMNNLSDYEQANGKSAYPNCNPPGAEYGSNGDHSGITIPGSPQRLWFANAVRSHHLWKIGVAHRPCWAPFDSDPRKLHRAMRPVLQDAIDNGMTMLWGGDIHVGSLCGPYYPTPPDHEEPRANGEIGCWQLTQAGGTLLRDVDEGVLPEGTCHWASGGATTNLIHATLVRFEGPVAYLTIWETTISVGAPITIVHQHTIRMNPGTGV